MGSVGACLAYSEAPASFLVQLYWGSSLSLQFPLRRVEVEASDPIAQTVRTSKVQIVDLAGSERLKPYEVV